MATQFQPLKLADDGRPIWERIAELSERIPQEVVDRFSEPITISILDDGDGGSYAAKSPIEQVKGVQ